MKAGGEKKMEKKKKRKMKTKLLLEYKVDLAGIEGNGDFPCPTCGAKLSPEDETEATYSIKEIKTRRDRLEELVIQCNRCESLIHLAGFKLLDSLE
jgi:transcription initiation factor IIE alpha subunit